jgi:hypothetical protein
MRTITRYVPNLAAEASCSTALHQSGMRELREYTLLCLDAGKMNQAVLLKPYFTLDFLVTVFFGFFLSFFLSLFPIIELLPM